MGIQPDLLLCRTEKKFDQKAKQKISLFCNISMKSVILVENANTIYEVPLKLNNQGILEQIFNHFSLKSRRNVNLKLWEDF